MRGSAATEPDGVSVALGVGEPYARDRRLSLRVGQTAASALSRGPSVHGLVPWGKPAHGLRWRRSVGAKPGGTGSPAERWKSGPRLSPGQRV